MAPRREIAAGAHSHETAEGPRRGLIPSQLKRWRATRLQGNADKDPSPLPDDSRPAIARRIGQCASSTSSGLQRSVVKSVRYLLATTCSAWPFQTVAVSLKRELR
jgi:hypothetical protein